MDPFGSRRAFSLFLSRARVRTHAAGPQVPGARSASIRSNSARPIRSIVSSRSPRSRILLFCSRKGHGPIRAISSAGLTKVRKRPGEAFTRVRARETPRIRIDEDRCNVSNHSSRQGQERNLSEPREERSNEAKWIGPRRGAA